MVSKKAAAPKSKPQNATHLSAKLSTPSSALTVSAFSPPALRLSLFASVILGLDAYRLRIHDTNTGRLRCEHIFEKGISINSLTWGSLLSKDKKSAKKKRKRLSNGTAATEVETKNAVVAAATNRGTVILFSPSEGAVVSVLEGEHVAAVKYFIFSEEEGRGWSCGVDKKLVEWDIERKLSMSTISLPDSSIQRLAPITEKVLSASHTVYSIDRRNPGMSEPATFSANSTLIHTLIVSKDEKLFLSAAEADRFINIFSLTENKHLGALVAESDVLRVSILQGSQEDILVTVTAEGVVEVFKAPFDHNAASTGSPAASRKKGGLTRKGEAKIRIMRPNGKDTASIADASVHDEELVLAWVEGGVNVVFERVRWANEGSLVLSGSIDITRAKTAGISANGSVMNGVKDVGKMAVDESQTVVVGGGDMRDVGMEDAPAPEPASDLEDEDEEEEQSDADDDADSVEGPEEPTFADRFQALEVSAKPTNALAPLPTKRSLEPPAANALTAVLTQALKTNDTTLLESCLHTTDTQTILNTVRKLSSPMAVTLLEKLSERLARKPGRAGSLGDWVRWTLVAHGGYLVTLPNLVRTLSGLYSTLDTRARALPRLLALQGRLDMLHAQVQLRQTIRAATTGKGDGEDENVLYVEGQTPESDSDDESDEEPEEVGMEGMRIEDASYIKSPAAFNNDEDERGSSADEGFLESEDDEDDDDMDSDEREEDEMAFLDLEASESENDDGDDADSVDYDDVDDVSGEEEEEIPVKKVGKDKAKARR
ncbi:Dip2/Utp12 family-domain-containing protein [Trichophaea hybrida]|nr:Dip2/Utp12 family-domain-containing protein [Trichophaea hybrida]